MASSEKPGTSSPIFRWSFIIERVGNRRHRTIRLTGSVQEGQAQRAKISRRPVNCEVMFLPALKLRSTLLILAALFIFVFCPTPAAACTCPREPSLRAFKRLRREADLIFVGTAKGSATNGGMNFTVERYWKGKPKKDMFVFTAQDSSCAVGFANGEKYLVIAFIYDNGDVKTNLCLRPGPVRERRMYIRLLGRGRVIR